MLNIPTWKVCGENIVHGPAKLIDINTSFTFFVGKIVHNVDAPDPYCFSTVNQESLFYRSFISYFWLDQKYIHKCNIDFDKYTEFFGNIDYILSNEYTSMHIDKHYSRIDSVFIWIWRIKLKTLNPPPQNKTLNCK